MTPRQEKVLPNRLKAGDKIRMHNGWFVIHSIQFSQATGHYNVRMVGGLRLKFRAGQYVPRWIDA